MALLMSSAEDAVFNLRCLRRFQTAQLSSKITNSPPMTPPTIAAVCARSGADVSWYDAATLVVVPPPVEHPFDSFETDG